MEKNRERFIEAGSMMEENADYKAHYITDRTGDDGRPWYNRITVYGDKKLRDRIVRLLNAAE